LAKALRALGRALISATMVQTQDHRSYKTLIHRINSPLTTKTLSK